MVATANVLSALDRRAAATSLRSVLGAGPDLVGLQEWWPWRRGLLSAEEAWTWSSAALGGTVVGARRDRFTLRGSRRVLLDLPGRAESDRRPWGWEPPRIASLARYADHDGSTVTLVSFHLAPGVERADSYRTDRPRLVARHRGEVRRLEAVIAEEQAAGHRVYAVGDANLHLLRLAGLVSAWTDRETPGTLGRRTVDDVHGPSRPDVVTTLATGSDHRAVVATWAAGAAR